MLDSTGMPWVGALSLRSLQQCPNSPRSQLSYECAQPLLPVRNLLGAITSPHRLPHKHLPSLFSSASSRITLAPVFPGYSCSYILLVEVEVLPASWKLLETGRPFMEMLTQLYLQHSTVNHLFPIRWFLSFLVKLITTKIFALFNIKGCSYGHDKNELYEGWFSLFDTNLCMFISLPEAKSHIPFIFSRFISFGTFSGIQHRRPHLDRYLILQLLKLLQSASLKTAEAGDCAEGQL